MEQALTLRGAVTAAAFISAGAASGALMRWVLGMLLNRFFPLIPPGTLAANFIAAFALGAALAFFGTHTAIQPHWRLMIITGFCGGLSTFSTFAGELLFLVQQNKLAHAALSMGLHVGGSVLLVLAGMVCFNFLRQQGG